MSERQGSGWNSQSSEIIGGYQVFQSQPVITDDGDQSGLIPGVEVKSEPLDNGYEQIGEPQISHVTSLHNAQSQTVEDLWSGSFRAQIRQILAKKSVDPNTTVQNVQDVVEKLLKKNEDVLSQNDAVGFKPHRRGRLPAEMVRKSETFPSIGQTAVFSTGLGQRGRIVPTGSARDRDDGIPMGRILRPKSPTLRCHMTEKDKSHFTSAVMETKIGSKESEEIFHVQEHEMVCGVSANTQLLDRDGRVVAFVDIKRYWCNFCSFSASSKNLLITHIMDHRFHCKYCRYQSFSRADVMQHSYHTHPEFQKTAVLMQYCTLLSDYLRIQNPNAAQLDGRPKRKGYCTEKGSSVNESCPDENPAKLQKLENFQTKVQSADMSMKLVGSLISDFDVFDMELDNTSESTEEADRESSIALAAFPAAQSSAASTPVTFAPGVVVQPTRVASPAVVSGPIITQVFSAGSLQPDKMDLGSGSQSNVSSSVSTPSSSPSSISSTMQPVRSNLYWNCGYCSFTSKSQSEVKDHSSREHSGKAYRYVALIKVDDCPTPPPASSSGREGSKSGNTISRKRKGQGGRYEKGKSEESGKHQGATKLAEETRINEETSDKDEKTPNNTSDAEARACRDNCYPETASEEAGLDNVFVKQEPADNEEEEIVPMKVCFPKPRIQAKENTTIKCWHCSYSARNLSHLRNHILQCHKGKHLLGVGPMKSKVFMCARSDCSFRSSSGAAFLNHASACTPWTKVTVSEEKIDSHLLTSLEKTKALAKESVDGKTLTDGTSKD